MEKIGATMRRISETEFKVNEKAVLEQERYESRQRLACTEVKRRYAGAKLEQLVGTTPEQCRAYDAIRGYQTELLRLQGASGTPCLILHGTPGTGKTHALSALVNAYAWNVGQARYGVCYDIYKVPVDWTHLEDLTYCPFLALDEIEVESAHQRQRLFHMIDARYASDRPTAVATNNIEGVPPKVLDRLRQRSLEVPMRWESHRQTSTTASESLQENAA